VYKEYKEVLAHNTKLEHEGEGNSAKRRNWRYFDMLDQFCKDKVAAGTRKRIQAAQASQVSHQCIITVHVGSSYH
jgi:hypothetical protein